MSLTAGILIISDTASLDASADRSGPFLADALKDAGYTISTHAVVQDEIGLIRSKVIEMVDRLGLDLVITSGGTGFGLRDVTPEAIAPLITRQTPALTHALTSHSLQKTPLAALSRGITGIRKSMQSSQESLIITLPGSPKAVQECLEILLSNGLLRHALELLKGGSGQARHQQMQGSLHRDAVSTGTDTGHARSHLSKSHEQHDHSQAHHHGHGHIHSHDHQNHHHHHDKGHDHAHGHHLHSHSVPQPRTTAADHSSYRTIDPSSGPSLRHRTSPYPILPLDEALSLIATETPSPSTVETVPVSSSLIGHVLAEDISAASDLPPGPTTNVDGYAVKASTTPAGEYSVVTIKTLQGRALKEGEIFRINTGQGLPAGTDAVVMVEDTELIQEQAGEEVIVKVLAQVEQGENVRPQGSDVRSGQTVLKSGIAFSALGGEIGTAAFLGRSEVKVYRKPRVAILSTGNELLDVNSKSSQSQETWGFSVFDSNRPSLKAVIEGMGYQVIDLGIVTDDVSTTLTALKRGIAEADVVLTTGGTSMGESDLLKPLIERQLSGKIVFGRVAMKPGKPTTFATIPNPDSSKAAKLVFALPGNPASALVTFYVFVLPALRKLSGYLPVKSQNLSNSWSLPKVKVRLADSMKLDPRPEFHRVVLKATADGALTAYSTGSQRSSGMHSMSTANALVALPALTPDGPKMLEAGEDADAIILGSIV